MIQRYLLWEQNYSYQWCEHRLEVQEWQKLKEYGILKRHGSPKDGYWEIVEK